MHTPGGVGAGGVVGALFPTATTSNCGNPAFAAIEARFTFNGPCAAANIGRVQTFYDNLSPIRTSGLDFLGTYDFGTVAGGRLSLGGSATYVIDYRIDAITIGDIVLQKGFDAAGLLNFQTSVYPLPKWKGSAFLEFAPKNHNFRLTFNYVDGYTDQRTAPFTTIYRDQNGAPVTIAAGKHIGSYATFDFNYRAALQGDLFFTLAVNNIADRDPPFVRTEFNYDAFTADGMGRTIKVGLRKSF